MKPANNVNDVLAAMKESGLLDGYLLKGSINPDGTAVDPKIYSGASSILGLILSAKGVEAHGAGIKVIEAMKERGLVRSDGTVESCVTPDGKPVPDGRRVKSTLLYTMLLLNNNLNYEAQNALRSLKPYVIDGLLHEDGGMACADRNYLYAIALRRSTTAIHDATAAKAFHVLVKSDNAFMHGCGEGNILVSHTRTPGDCGEHAITAEDHAWYALAKMAVMVYGGTTFAEIIESNVMNSCLYHDGAVIDTAKRSSKGEYSAAVNLIGPRSNGARNLALRAIGYHQEMLKCRNLMFSLPNLHQRDCLMSLGVFPDSSFTKQGQEVYSGSPIINSYDMALWAISLLPEGHKLFLGNNKLGE